MRPDQRLTPFQRDYLRMADALNIAISTVGAADEALTRRIIGHDNPGGERVHVHTSDPADPTGDEVARRATALENREAYRDVAVMAIWNAIKAAQRATDMVLRNEPAVTPPGARNCATKDCGNWASKHLQPGTDTSMSDGVVVEDLCDECWAKICTACYIRPKAEYRQSCDACRKRAERQAA